jgi:hypothetical protein
MVPGKKGNMFLKKAYWFLGNSFLSKGTKLHLQCRFRNALKFLTRMLLNFALNCHLKVESALYPARLLVSLSRLQISAGGC